MTIGRLFLRLEECLKVMGIAFDALQKDHSQLEVQCQKDSKDQKKLEQALDKVEKSLESTKDQLICIEKANLGLYNQIQVGI